MLIEDIMNRNVVTVKPTDSIRLAMLVAAQQRIRHLPVLDENNKLVGILSDRDLRDACPSKFECEQNDEIYNRPVSEIMHRDVITAHPLDFVEEAAFSLYDNKIGCLPVIDQDELKGIITETDILHTLVELMGVQYPSSHVEVEVNDQPGMLADVAAVFKQTRSNVTSVLVFPGKHHGKKNLVFRVQTIDTRKIKTALEEAGYKVCWPQEPGGAI
ncbi:acetoin utilization AcuB family protein [Ammoniphilus sp. CFH 90114]|uniref:acetoin utilization AcuB family protein n=1 Tax=Ammoniphilus sp. CFH 90114 TaxID=2493665 RepID=UPI00100DE7CF|nr:acetoin utilization AcuB family protein [Ammoniphilus sp. CFH 90114]RXT13500.1 CBS domain-containing protein [Ammoniphilus sp. CFH 90114]